MQTSDGLLLAACALALTAGIAGARPPAQIPSDGVGWRQLEQEVDAAVFDTMNTNNLPGMTVAVSKDGRLLLTKGYGYANTSTELPMKRDFRARIGSVTKATITGPAAFQLMKSKNIDPATKTLYGPNGVFATTFDSDITIGVLRHTPIVDVAIDPQDRVYAWYQNGTFSAGTSSDLDQHIKAQPYKLPAGKNPVNISGIGFTRHGYVVTLYDDKSVSVGNPDDLGKFSVDPESAKLPHQKSPYDIVGMDYSKDGNRLYVWYDDGTSSIGSLPNLDQIEKPKPFQSAPSSYPFLIRGMGIDKNNHVYAWFGNNVASSGTSTKLHHYRGLYAYTMADGVDTPNWQEWYRKITLQNLLDHRAEFTRSGNEGATSRHFNTPSDALTYEPGTPSFPENAQTALRAGDDQRTFPQGEIFESWIRIVASPYVRDDYLKKLDLHQDVVPELDKARDLREAWNHKYDDEDNPVPFGFDSGGTGMAAGGFRASAQSLLRLTSELKNVYPDADLERIGWAKRSGGVLDHSGKRNGGTAYVRMYPQGFTASSGQNLGNIHVALVTNIRMKGVDEDDEEPPPGLRDLADTIALAVPSSGVPSSYDAADPDPLTLLGVDLQPYVNVPASSELPFTLLTASPVEVTCPAQLRLRGIIRSKGGSGQVQYRYRWEHGALSTVFVAKVVSATWTPQHDGKGVLTHYQTEVSQDVSIPLPPAMGKASTPGGFKQGGHGGSYQHRVRIEIVDGPISAWKPYHLVCTSAPSTGAPRRVGPQPTRVSPEPKVAPVPRRTGGPPSPTQAPTRTAGLPDLSPLDGLTLGRRATTIPWGETATISTDAAFAKRGGRCSFRYRYVITNQGQSAAGPTVAHIRLNAPDGPVLSKDVIAAVPSGGRQVASGVLALQVGTWMLYVHVDADDQIAESDEQNNLRRVRVQVDGDCR